MTTPLRLLAVVVVLGSTAFARADEPAVRAVDIDGGDRLEHFHRALADLASGRRADPVRIVLYGDSNHAADRFTGSLRRLLQARYGDAGHGFVAFGDPWPGYRHQDVRRAISSGFETFNPTTNRGSDNLWGYGGVAVEGGLGGTLRVGTSDEGPVGGAVEHFTILYLQRPQGQHVRVAVDDQPQGTFSTRGTGRCGAFSIQVPDGAHELAVRPEGPVRFFGAVLERARPGIVLDAIGIGGLSTYRLLRVDERTFIEQLSLRRPDLVVLTMGTNDQSTTRLPQERRRLMARLARAAPDASVLTLSPPDHARWNGMRWKPEPRMKRVTEVLRAVAEDTGSAFWDLHAAMGGEGSMDGWARIGFATGDRIHFRQPLADRLAQALFDAIDRDHARWSASAEVVQPLAMR